MIDYGFKKPRVDAEYKRIYFMPSLCLHLLIALYSGRFSIARARAACLPFTPLALAQEYFIEGDDEAIAKCAAYLKLQR